MLPPAVTPFIHPQEQQKACYLGLGSSWVLVSQLGASVTSNCLQAGLFLSSLCPFKSRFRADHWLCWHHHLSWTLAPGMPWQGICHHHNLSCVPTTLDTRFIGIYDQYRDVISVSTLGTTCGNWLWHGVMSRLHACRGAEAGSQGPSRRQRCPDSVTDWVWQDAGLLVTSPVSAAVPSRCLPR